MKKPIPFGKYYLLERINVGGMAEVFKAKAFGVEGFERLVAVKRILPNIAEDEEFITMFIDEAKIAVQLQHASIAQIFDLGKVDDSYFIALEFVHGKDLRAIFDRGRQRGEAMPIPQACFIIMQVCEGLDYAHNKRDSQGHDLNLVHRDISPQNVLIGYEGETKLIDFGIAKAAGKASKTQAGILKGKFGYMSPEQVRGLPIDRRSDIFAMGIVLYELLTGERLFIGESDFSTLEKVRNVEILPPSSYNRKIPEELERICLKALAKDVEDRYQNAIDLHDDLQAFLYTIGEFYSRKDLAGWMRKTFSAEIEEESAKLEQFRELAAPTTDGGGSTATPSLKRVDAGVSAPAGPLGGSGPNASAARPRSESGDESDIAWDDEELETQIFDKEPQGEGEEIVGSGEIVLEEEDDRTQAGDPPPEVAALLAGRASGGAAAGSGPPAGLRAALSGGAMTGKGPPPGLAGAGAGSSGVLGGMGGLGPKGTILGIPAAGLPLPRSGGLPLGLGGRVSRALSPIGSGPLGLPRPGLVPAPASLPPPLSGGFPEPISAPISEPFSDLSSPDQMLARFERKPRTGLYAGIVVGALAVAVGGVMLWQQANRPGEITVTFSPGSATVLLDGAKVGEASPLTLSRPPGSYALSFLKDGYRRNDQTVEVKAGEPLDLKVTLEPSEDTGFELTSDPLGELVWMDGQPFMAPGPDGQMQQTRTNFRATSIAPGRHVVEIRNPKFQDWRHEFELGAGSIPKIHAALIGKSVPGGGGASPPLAAAVPQGGEEPAIPGGFNPVPIEMGRASSASASAPRQPRASRKVKSPEEQAGGGDDPFEVAAAPAKPARAAAKRRPPGADDGFAPLGLDDEPAPKKAASAGGECSVTLGSKPWAQVWIDGKNTSRNTPLADFKLPCGKRRFTFKRPDLGIDETYSDIVKAGEMFKRVYTLVNAPE